MRENENLSILLNQQGRSPPNEVFDFYKLIDFLNIWRHTVFDAFPRWNLKLVEPRSRPTKTKVKKNIPSK